MESQELRQGFTHDSEVDRVGWRANQILDLITARYQHQLKPDLKRAEHDALNYVKARLAVDSKGTERREEAKPNLWLSAILIAERGNWNAVAHMLRREAANFMAETDEEAHSKGVALENLADSLPEAMHCT